MPIVVKLEEGLLEAYFERLLRRGRSPSFVKNSRSTLRRFLRQFADVPLERLTAEHIERFLDSLGVSNRTWRVYLERIRSFLTWCCRKGYIEDNPCADVDPPLVRPTYRPAPRRAEWERLRAVCRTDEEALMVELLYFTGLRLEEFRQIRVSDVDLAERRIYVRQGKGGKPRTVVFPPRVLSLLVRHLADRHGYLFESPRHRGYPRSPGWIDRTLARLGREAGLPYHVTAHVLRHGFTRLCKTNQVPLEVAARFLGHADINTTASIYGRLDEDDLQAVYDRQIPS
jgi:integrase